MTRVWYIGTWWLTLISCTLSVMVDISSLSRTGDCEVGVKCSQCPVGHYAHASNGSLLCCPGCLGATLYYVEISNTCVCFAGSASSHVPRILRLPLSSKLLAGGPKNPGSSSNVDDAFFIINHRDGTLGQEGAGVSHAVQHALTLMADTLESLHARVTRLEKIIEQMQDSLDSKHSESVNRVNTVPPPTTPGPPIDKSCPTNYTKIGDECYYVSVWHDHRAIWKDARTACEGLDGKLAETLTRMAFLDLTRKLGAVPSVSGFSYWVGGFYPGLSWLWSYAGENVTLNPAYWADVDSTGKTVTPGDTASGRCLSFAYSVKSSKYYYQADECGYEKFFICQLVEGGQLRILG